MSININKVVLVGRLTKDIEVKKTSSGLSFTTFTVAVNRPYSSKNAQGQPTQPTADFINCVAWRQSADFLGKYASKGSLVSVEGRIQTRSYDGNDGRKVFVTEVLAEHVEVGSTSGNGSNAGGSNGGYVNYSQQSSNGYQQNSGGYQQSAANNGYQNYGQPKQQAQPQTLQPANDSATNLADPLDFGGMYNDQSF